MTPSRNQRKCFTGSPSRRAAGAASPIVGENAGGAPGGTRHPSVHLAEQTSTEAHSAYTDAALRAPHPAAALAGGTHFGRGASRAASGRGPSGPYTFRTRRFARRIRPRP